MKIIYTLLLAFIFLTFQIGFSQSMVNKGGKILVSEESSIVVKGNFINKEEGAIANAGKITITGDWTNNATSGNLLQGTTGLVKFNGPDAQTIGGSSQTWFNKLVLEADVYLGSSILVSDEFMFSDASIYLGAYNLYMDPASQFLGVDPASSYVVTDYVNLGYLIREVGFTPVEFPVGDIYSYTPITITNNGIVDDYRVLTFSDVVSYGNDGNTIPEIENCVKKSWLVWEDVNGGSDLDVTVKWNAGDEGSTFDRSACAVGYAESGSWVPDFSGGAAGADPYTRTRIGLTTPRPLTVGGPGSNMVIMAVLYIEANLLVYLEGPYNGTDMDTHLNGNPELVEGLPLSQPYNTAPWNYNGTESVPSIPNTDIVDWALVEFRGATSAATATDATTIYKQAAFLLKDGSIVGLDGFSNISFSTTAGQQLYVVIRHRNHIDIMSSNPLTDAGGLYTYNFTSTIDKVYGGAAGYKELASGAFGMAGGDADANGTVDGSDKEAWAITAGTIGYNQTDLNLDGQVNNQDKNDTWTGSDGIITQVPSVGMGEVYNPATGKIWMDRNLGASQVATSSDDPAAFGHLYQWGRAAEGHEIRTSVITSDNATTSTPNEGNSWDGLFIYEQFTPYDWLAIPDNMLWQGVDGINNPCPSGFRLPTIVELNDERLSWESNDAAGAFGSPLKLAVGGRRNNTNGVVASGGSTGFYWTSSFNGNTSWGHYVIFSSSEAYFDTGSKASGGSVRCIKD